MEQHIKDAAVRMMKLLYDWEGEVVVDVSEETTSLFVRGNWHEADDEVINSLIETGIIEKDGGCEDREEGIERVVYQLTPDARKRIREILQKRLST